MVQKLSHIGVPKHGQSSLHILNKQNLYQNSKQELECGNPRDAPAGYVIDMYITLVLFRLF